VRLRTDIALLVQRVAAGGLLLLQGVVHLSGRFGGTGLTGFAAELRGFGLPAAAPIPFALAALQVALGTSVLAGAATRIGALAAALFMVVVVMVLAPNGWAWTGRGVEFPLFWAAMLLSLALTGGGKFSLDAWLRRRGCDQRGT
jgi:putative oxidoreductase